MKVKFNVGKGCAVISYQNNHATIEQAIDLLKRDEVISITVTKQTPAQYLKNTGIAKEEKKNGMSKLRTL